MFNFCICFIDWNVRSCSGCTFSEFKKCLANLILNCESLIEFLISFGKEFHNAKLLNIEYKFLQQNLKTLKYIVIKLIKLTTRIEGINVFCRKFF